MIHEDLHVRSEIEQRVPTLWFNPERSSDERRVCRAVAPYLLELAEARARLQRFEPLLADLFAELAASKGVIDSPLTDSQQLAIALGIPPCQGRLFVKRDDALPVVGSIKARGGAHAVLEIAERVALAEGLLDGRGHAELGRDDAKAVFQRYSICVGSTGNLGLSVGTFAARLGFSTVVHMSAAAKPWKKALLRQRGACVVEHGGDYEEALAAGRKAAQADGRTFFIDDENSVSLLAGYATAAQLLQNQLRSAGVAVDDDHPMFVYIPCGVGGAPTGISLGLREAFGPAAHCFFVQPVETPCFLIQMLAGDGRHPSVYDFGLSGRTEADGLAVPRASLLAAEVARPLIGGVLTVEDDTLFRHLALAHDVGSFVIEPSAAAGFSGPGALVAQGSAYLERWGLQNRLANATHIVWTTGGSMVPKDEYAGFLAEGKRLEQWVR